MRRHAAGEADVHKILRSGFGWSNKEVTYLDLNIIDRVQIYTLYVPGEADVHKILRSGLGGRTLPFQPPTPKVRHIVSTMTMIYG